MRPINRNGGAWFHKFLTFKAHQDGFADGRLRKKGRKRHSLSVAADMCRKHHNMIAPDLGVSNALENATRLGRLAGSINAEELAQEQRGGDLQVVGRDGFEPSTSGLKVRCSTN
jgi:hypothetical protein